MPDIAIVTDSAACLTQELTKQYGIQILPLNLLAGGKIYRDWIDITPSKAYELFLKDPESFRTSPPNPQECFEVFRRLSKKAQNILCITLSVKISTLYNIVCIAQERAQLELQGTRIELLDSGTATCAQGFVALSAARSVEAGNGFNEVIKAAEQVKNKLNTIVLLDTVRYVYRSGRVPKIAAQAASVLNIRPIFTLDKTVHFITASRSKKYGVERMLKMMRDKVGRQPVHCAVMHAYDPEAAELLKAQIFSEFNCLELWIGEFSPVMGYATGTGTLGLAFYTE